MEDPAIESFQQIFIVHLLWARHYSRHGENQVLPAPYRPAIFNLAHLMAHKLVIKILQPTKNIYIIFSAILEKKKKV